MEYVLLLLLGLLHLSQRCHSVSRDEDHKILSFLTSRDPSDSCWAVSSSSYSHNFFCVNGMSFQRSLSFLNGCQGLWWSSESETSTCNIWFSWCWSTPVHEEEMEAFWNNVFFLTHCLVFFLWHQGYLKKTKQQACETKMSLKGPRNDSWVILVIRAFPSVLGSLNLDCVCSQESGGHIGKINN